MKLTTTVICLLALCSGNADAADRNASLINSFQVFCTLESPVFAHIDQKAAAMRLAVHRDIGASKTDGYFAHSETWFVSLTTGPHELVASEGNGPNGHGSDCGISAPDPNGETFKKDLVAEMKLGQPTKEFTSANGQMHFTIWEGVFGAGSSLRLMDATPNGYPGAALFYDTMGPTKP